MAKLETLQEDFEFGGIDSGKWTSFGGSQVNIGTNLDLEITSSLAGNYIGLNSIATYDLTGSYAFVQLTSVGNQSIVSWEVYPIYLIADANNKIFIRISGNTVQPIKVVAGVTTNIGVGVAYNVATMKWFRIREASGTTYFEYAADPTSTWTLITSTANPITVTALTMEFLCGTWQAESSTTMAKFDNFNLTPGQMQFNWKGYAWNKRIHAGAASNNQSWSPNNISGPDANNYLTFQITNAGSSPIACEIFSVKRGWGYGIYTIVVGTELDNIDHRNAFGNLFTFDFTAYPGYKEIDVAEVRDYNSHPNIRILNSHVWNNGGVATFTTNDMDIPNDIVHTHRAIWEPGKITFDSFSGVGITGNNYFHTVQTDNIPVPGLERCHINIWNNTGVANYQNAPAMSVVVQDFSFVPLTKRNTATGRVGTTSRSAVPNRVATSRSIVTNW